MSTDPCRPLPSSRQGSARPRLARLAPPALAALGLGLLAIGALAQQAEDPERDAEGNIVFLHALDNQPIEFDLRPEEEITPAVEQFHKTAENAYAGDPDAIAAGKQIYARLCQACHLADGSGRIGPGLTDEEGARARTGTERGRFEIIYAGGAGAMQAFGQRLDQDEILKVMAYLEVLRENAKD